MFASITNGVFAVPENPVRRGEGMGRLGYAMGQAVIMEGASAPGDVMAGTGSQYSVGPNGSLQYNQIGPYIPGDQYTAEFCNAAINGGNASSADLFQCSTRGYVGANGVYKPGTYVPPASIPPALVPDPPTSVTIPGAVMTITTAPPVIPQARCAPGVSSGIDLDNCWLAVGAGIVAYLLLGGNRG